MPRAVKAGGIQQKRSYEKEVYRRWERKARVGHSMGPGSINGTGESACRRRLPKVSDAIVEGVHQAEKSTQRES